MTVTHDVIVVGAGPAGAAAARAARAAGLSVALIDKARFPRDKLCGGGITGRCRTHLDEAFGPGFAADLCLTTTHVRLTDRGRCLGDLPDAPPIHMTMRRDFDAALSGAAVAAGAEPFLGRRIAAVDPAGATLTLAGGLRLAGHVLIGADGVASPTARALFGRAFDPRRTALALEVEVQDRTGTAVEIDLAAIPHGYGWDFPKAGGRTLGLGGIGRQSADLRAALAAFLLPRGAGAALDTCKGAFLPAGDFRRVPGKGRALLAGDAAGLVDPITGEGIGWAIRSGAAAAAAAAAAIAAGDPASALSRYRSAIAPIHRELRWAGLLKHAVYAPPLRPLFLRVLEREPAIQRRFLALLAGERDYADMGLGSLRRMAGRLVRAAFARAA
ncbi:MAG: geranylgeranyl reductase family protein [Gemmobacter sp.]